MADRGVDIHPRLLAQFVTLSDHAHVGRAATALGLSPRALVKTIGELEREAGEPLLRRTDRKVELTPAGEVFLGGARRVLAAVERLQTMAGTDRATLRVSHIANADTLSLVLDDLTAKHPEIALYEQVADGAEQLALLQDHRLDVALCRAPGPLPAGLASRTVRHDRFVVLSTTAQPCENQVDPRATPLVVPSYGRSWQLHDDLIDQFEQDCGARIERIAVPGGTGRELPVLVRRAGGRRALVASSTVGSTDLAATGRIWPLQPYLQWLVVWRREDTSPELAAFLASAAAVGAAQGWLVVDAEASSPWFPADDLSAPHAGRN